MVPVAEASVDIESEEAVTRKRCDTCEWWYNKDREPPWEQDHAEEWRDWPRGHDVGGDNGICAGLPTNTYHKFRNELCSLWASRDGKQLSTSRLIQDPDGKFVVAIREDGEGTLYEIHHEAEYLEPVCVLREDGPLVFRVGKDGEPDMFNE